MVFTYVIVYRPRQTKKQRDEGIEAQPEILVGPETIIAKSEVTARMSAALEIPNDHRDRLDQVEIIVRPF